MVPEDVENQVALDPEKAHQWAVRTIKLEKKFISIAGQDNLDSVPKEKLREIALDPVDVQGAKLSFTQLLSRSVIEADTLRQPDMTPEAWSRIKGNGRLFEDWRMSKFIEVTNRFSSPDDPEVILQEEMEELEAIRLVDNTLEGVIRSGKLVEFAQRVEKAHQENLPGKA